MNEEQAMLKTKVASSRGAPPETSSSTAKHHDHEKSHSSIPNNKLDHPQRPAKRRKCSSGDNKNSTSLGDPKSTTNLKANVNALCGELLLGQKNDSTTTTDPSSASRANSSKTRHHKQENEATTTTSLLAKSELEMTRLLAVDEAWRSMMRDRIHAKANEINALRQQQDGCCCCCLLGLSHELLECIANYLREQDLFALEESSSSFIQTTALTNQWTVLDQKRTLLRSKKTFSNARERGIDFAKISRYASIMEQSARLHYSTSTLDSEPKETQQYYQWPEKLYTCADFFNDFLRFDVKNDEHEEDHSRRAPPLCREFFVRLSYKETNGSMAVLLEGFQNDFGVGWRHDTNHFAQYCLHDERESFMTFEFVGLMDKLLGKQRMGLLPKNRPAVTGEDLLGTQLQWALSDRKRFLDRLFVTVLACDTSTKDSPSVRAEPQLVIATNGYFSSKYRREVVYVALTPQSPTAKHRTASSHYCVNVGFLIRERDSDSFAILLEWGDPAKV